MALFQGLLDREGRVLDKANRFAQFGFAALETDAQKRAAIAFTKALEVLEATGRRLEGAETSSEEEDAS